MKRRQFISLLGGAGAMWPFAVRAQEPGRIYRLGGLTNISRTAPHFVSLFDELRRAGFVEGRNLVVAGWTFRAEQFPEMAAARGRYCHGAGVERATSFPFDTWAYTEPATRRPHAPPHRS